MVFMKQVVDSQSPGLNRDNTLDRTKSGQIINPADLNSLEEALKIKDAKGAEIIACTMGPDSASNLLLTAGAMGADVLLHISDSRLSGSDTFSTATVLSRVISCAGGCDLVFCGRRSTDGETGQVGPELAAILDMPCAVNCTKLGFEGSGIACTVLHEHEIADLSLPLPSLVTFYNSINSPRMPSIAGLRNTKKESIKRLSLEDIGLEEKECGLAGSPTRVMSIKQNTVPRRTPERLSLSEGIIRSKELIKNRVVGRISNGE